VANTGNVFPGSGTNVDFGGTSNAWTSPGNIVSDNATDTNGMCPTDYLIASTFGFAIPSNATILGVTVRVEASETGTGSTTYEIQLNSAATPTLIGASKTSSTVNGTTKVIQTFGGIADRWSATLTPSIVNGSGFGVSLWSTDATGPNTLAVDFITIAIEYYVISPSPVTTVPQKREIGYSTIPNLLLTTLAAVITTGVVLRGPICFAATDADSPRLAVQVFQPVNLLGSTLAPTDSPFVSAQTQTILRTPWLPQDTSQETPKPLYEDADRAFTPLPALAAPGKPQTLADTSSRNISILEPVAGDPPFSNLPQVTVPRPQNKWTPLFHRYPAEPPAPPVFDPFFTQSAYTVIRVQWLPANTSLGTPKTLFSDPAVGDPGYTTPQPSLPWRKWLPANTSAGTPKPLYADESFAPSQSEWPPLQRRPVRFTNTSFQNKAVLPEPVAGDPFVSKQISSAPPLKPALFSPSEKGTFPALFPVEAAPFPGSAFTAPQAKPRSLNQPTEKGTFPPTFPVAENPRVQSYSFVAPVRVKWLPADTSAGMPKNLDHEFAPANIETIPIPRANARLTNTSYRNATLLTPPPEPPIVNPPGFRIDRKIPVTDTSQSSSVDLLTFDPGPPFFTTWGWPAPIEYRNLTLRTWDSQAFPENIPPAPDPVPPVRVEVGGGPKKPHKPAKQEREEFLDEVIKEILVPAKKTDLPAPLQPVAKVIPVVVTAPVVPLIMPAAIEIPAENDDETIAALIALGLF
jgi:hypothetical protein